MQSLLNEVHPIFVLGSVRSGTSLLRLILTAHPEICIPPESLFWIKLRPRFSKYPDLSSQIEFFTRDLFQEEKFQKEWKLNRQAIITNLSKVSPLSYPEAVSIVYWTYLQTNFPNARIWGDKNPGYLKHVDTILKDFPRARFIHIIRDIRSIYASLAVIHRDKSSRIHWKRMHAPLPYATHQWRYACELFVKKKNHPQVYTMFYEDLVSDPITVLNSLCSWLKIPFHDSMLQFYDLNRKKQLVAKFALKWEQKTLEPIDRNRADSWQKELSVTQLQAIELLNHTNMRRMGYLPVSQGLRLRGSLRIFIEYLPILRKRWKRMLLRRFLFRRRKK